MVVGALAALVVAVGLLAASLFVVEGLVFAWLSLAADALAAVLLVTALRRRAPRHPPTRPPVP